MHRFPSLHAPELLQAVLHEVSTRALDDTGGARSARYTACSRALALAVAQGRVADPPSRDLIRALSASCLARRARESNAVSTSMVTVADAPPFRA